MARKSAAQLKAKKQTSDLKQKLEDMPSLEETFENAKQAFVNTLEVSVQLAGRIDNLLNIRDYAYKFWDKADKCIPTDGRGTLGYCKKLQDLSIQIYKDMLEIVKTFDLKEFKKEDMKDYFEELMPIVEGIEDEDQLCAAGLIFLTIKPFGEKMNALHHTILDEAAQRKFMEEQCQ